MVLFFFGGGSTLGSCFVIFYLTEQSNWNLIFRNPGGGSLCVGDGMPLFQETRKKCMGVLAMGIDINLSE